MLCCVVLCCVVLCCVVLCCVVEAANDPEPAATWPPPSALRQRAVPASWLRSPASSVPAPDSSVEVSSSPELLSLSCSYSLSLVPARALVGARPGCSPSAAPTRIAPVPLRLLRRRNCRRAALGPDAESERVAEDVETCEARRARAGVQLGAAHRRPLAAGAGAEAIVGVGAPASLRIVPSKP